MWQYITVLLELLSWEFTISITVVNAITAVTFAKQTRCNQ